MVERHQRHRSPLQESEAVSRVLVLSHERLRKQMSGPSIRNWEVAGVLATENEVVLAAPGPPERSSGRFTVTSYDELTLPSLVRESDVVLCTGFLVHEHPVLLEAKHLAIDLYGPFQLENLHQGESLEPAQHYQLALDIRGVVTKLLLAGDVFFAASDRQRDFWLGWLDAVGRINPLTHRADPGYASLVRLMPLGLSPEPPRPGPARFRSVFPGIGPDDFLVLWGGGIWEWFDPITLIKAVDATKETVPNLRLVFGAMASPSEKVPAHRMAIEAKRLSDSLGLTGTRVFFNESWVPYDERGQMYLESDLGVSVHKRDIETHFSFRTRVLDYLWAGLPIITTEGDSMADLVHAEDLGAVVAYDDVDSLASALTRLGTDPERRLACGARSSAAGRRFQWPVVTEPLLDYCRSPEQAPDRHAARARLAGGTTPAAEPPDPPVRRRSEVTRVARKSIETLRRDGASAAFAKGREYVKRRLRRSLAKNFP
jgi:glycosyltransferase involved in cell wall biosynthesis